MRNPMDRVPGDDLDGVSRAGLDASARAVLLTEYGNYARPVGAVLDASVFGRVDADKRYVAVVRSPDSYIVVGRYASDGVAAMANENFYDGMRALVGA